MSFVGKETFREGNIWLEEGAVAGLPFKPYLYAYQEEGSTYTKVAAPPVPVSAEFTTWFGFTYRDTLPDSFTSADGDPSQFSLTVADVTVRGGAFIDYGDGSDPRPLEELAPDDLVGFAKGTSDDFPAGSSVTWSVLDAGMVVIGERTIPFGTESGRTGPFTSAAYGFIGSTGTLVDGSPLVLGDDANNFLIAAPGVAVWPTTVTGAEMSALMGTLGEVAAAGADYIGQDGIDMLGGQSASDLLEQMPAYAGYPIVRFTLSTSPTVVGLYRDAALSDPVWEQTVTWTVNHVEVPIVENGNTGNGFQAAVQVNSRANGPALTTVHTDWGDGTVEEALTDGDPPQNTYIGHQYATPGSYTVQCVSPDPYWLDGSVDLVAMGDTVQTPSTFPSAGSANRQVTITCGVPILPTDAITVWGEGNWTFDDDSGVTFTPDGSGGMTFRFPTDVPAGWWCANVTRHVGDSRFDAMSAVGTVT